MAKSNKEAEALVAANVENYVTEKTETGKKSVHSGDTIASDLAPLDIKQVHEIASVFLGENTEKKYKHLNIGMQRMNVGNRLRKVLYAEGAEKELAKFEKACTKATKEAVKAAKAA